MSLKGKAGGAAVPWGGCSCSEVLLLCSVQGSIHFLGHLQYICLTTEGCCLVGTIHVRQKCCHLSIDVFWGFTPLLQRLGHRSREHPRVGEREPEPLTFRVLRCGAKNVTGRPGGFSYGEQLQPRSRCAHLCLSRMLWASGKVLSLHWGAGSVTGAGGAVRGQDCCDTTALPWKREQIQHRWILKCL